ncbi:MAG: matrixin family metalloprotease, partial [Proteobacteria bacterium]
FSCVNGNIIKQPTNILVFCGSTVAFPSGGTYRNSYVDAMSRWNAVQNVQISLAAPGCSFASSITDNLSSTWFTSSMPSGSETATATSRPQWSETTCRYTTNDIVFNNAYTWNSSEDMRHIPFNNDSDLPFYSVALHEMGHALGLKHEERGWNIMGIDQSFVTYAGSTTDYRPGENATAGAVGSYGESGTASDVGVSIWRYDAAATGSSMYSNHKEGSIRNPSTSAATSSNANTIIPGPNRRFILNRGNTYRIELTFETIGPSTPSWISIDGYLSSDFYFGSGDSFLGGWTIASPTRDWPTETYVDITVPSTAATGTAYIGFNIGCTIVGSICTDTNYWNNSTYYAVTIL